MESSKSEESKELYEELHIDSDSDSDMSLESEEWIHATYINDTPLSIRDLIDLLLPNQQSEHSIYQPMNDVPLVLTNEALENLIELPYDLIKNTQRFKLDNKCSICLSQFDENHNINKYTTVPCTHIFHSDCIKTYLSTYNYRCPICRHQCGNYYAKKD